MALTEKTVFDRIEILEDGQVQLRKALIVERDGVEIARDFHREVRTPDDDFSDLPDRVQKIMKANFDHTKTKERWQNKKRNNE